MIAQVYHIQGDFPSYILTWTLLGLPLVYILRSSMASILFIIGITTYAAFSGDGIYAINFKQYLFWPLFALIIPHYWSLLKEHNSNFQTFLNWIIPILLCFVIGFLTRTVGGVQFFNYLCLFTLFIFIGQSKYIRELPLARNGYRVIGKLGVLSILFMFSFDEIWQDFVREFDIESFAEHTEFHGLFVLFLASFGILIWQLIMGKLKTMDPLVFLFILMFPLIFIGLTAYLIFNILILLISIYYIWRGSKEFKLRTLNLGILSLATLISCRFFDVDISFVVRGIVFVLMGTGFFTINFIMLKKKKKNNYFSESPLDQND